jgi:Cys-rich four helix bundle protein (predicted Tat secretion target)
MNRRELLRSAALATASTMTAAAFAQQQPESKPSTQHKHHWQPSGKYSGLAGAAADCATKADFCTAHCQDAIAAGDSTYTSCLKSSAEVATVCNALRSLAAQNAQITPRMASVALQSCKTCETECRKHEKTDEVCKACAEACAACAKECQKAQTA